jgi:hypothetical protein
MMESAPFETTLSLGQLMRCGIVKMHYRSCRVHISPGVQNLSEQIQHMLEEVVAVGLAPRREPIDKDGSMAAQKHCEYGCRRSYRVRHSCWDFIGRYTRHPLLIIMLKKPSPIARHNIRESDDSLVLEPLK